MRILFSGNYDPNYNRTLVISKGLKENDVEIVQRPLKNGYKKGNSKLFQTGNECDAIFLPSFTHSDVTWARKLFPDKKIIFDPLISKYLTKVFDYKTIHKWSPRALKNWWKDKSAMQKADIVLADTEAHRQYFHSTFNIPLDKIKVLYIGVDQSTFYPIPKNSVDASKFIVGFYGSFAPLQGVEKIVQAANILRENENLHFEIVGGGFVESGVRALAQKLDISNITFTPTIPIHQLNDKINCWDICLGIFGESLKSDLVIPNKVYHYAACQKAIITKESVGIQELFTNRENVFLSSNKAEDLAANILTLKENQILKNKIELGAYKLVKKDFSSQDIARSLIEILSPVQL